MYFEEVKMIRPHGLAAKPHLLYITLFFSGFFRSSKVCELFSLDELK